MTDLLSNLLGQLIGELIGEPIGAALDRRALGRALDAAVRQAEQRFAREYRQRDAELADALAGQTRFADLPSVRAALRELLTRPFHDPAPHVAALQRSFAEVLPERTDRARVDAAVAAFLGYLGQEVLYIPQLRDLYAMALQKAAAESGRSFAASADALAQQLERLRGDLALLPSSQPAALLAAPAPERARPWHNLPQRSYTRFVGRQAELAQLTQLLLPHPRSRHFIVTLDGIGGVGKSALALELAYRYRDGYAELPPTERFEAIVWASAKRTLLSAGGIQQRRASFNTLDDLFREVAAVLELPAILEAAPAQRRALIERALTAQRTLLIVDNLETVDDEELLAFLRELPDPTKAIVTTRHRIDIAYAIRLTGMPEPDARALMAVEAARKNVALPPEAEAELFRRSGGVPLAIVWSIGLMSLGYGVESVLRRLGSGQSDIARFCFTESVAIIRGRDAYTLLLALALFEYRIDRERLGVVAGLADDPIGRDDGLAELLQLSLVNQKGERFFLLPLTQRYALDELAAQPERERALRERWVAVLARIAAPYSTLFWRYPDRRTLKQEGRHIAALAGWAQRAEQPGLLLQFAPALMIYYDTLGDWAALQQVAQAALEHAYLAQDIPHIMLIEMRLCWQLNVQGKHTEALDLALHSLKLAQESGDAPWECHILLRLAQFYRLRGDSGQAAEHCRRAAAHLDRIPEADRPFAFASIENELGKLARERTDWPAAQAHFQTALKIFGDESDPALHMDGAWGVLSNLGFIEQQLGHLDTAAQMYAQSLEICREIGGKGALANQLYRLAALETQRGRPDAARAYAQEALDWAMRLGMVWERQQAEALIARLGAAAQASEH